MSRKHFEWKLKNRDDSARRADADRRHPQRDAGLVLRRRQVPGPRPGLRARHRDGRAGRRCHRHRSRIDAAGLQPALRGGGVAAPGPRAQAPPRQALHPHLGGHLQGGGGRARPGTGSGDHQRPQRADLRPATGARRGSRRRRADPQPHARHAGDLGQAAAAARCDGHDHARSGRLRAPGPAGRVWTARAS